MIKPLHDLVLITPDDSSEQKTKSGLYIPSKGPAMTGVVEAVGPGKYDSGVMVRPAVEVGDRVRVANWGSTEIDGSYLVPYMAIISVED